MTCFYDRLEQRIAKCGNPVCMGMDPVLKLIPLEGTPEDRIKRFYSDILECCLKRNVQPAVVKPNSAYYECVSVQSMLVLQQLIADYRSAGIPVILDAKRGDIGKSSAAYACRLRKCCLRCLPCRRRDRLSVDGCRFRRSVHSRR